MPGEKFASLLPTKNFEIDPPLISKEDGHTREEEEFLIYSLHGLSLSSGGAKRKLFCRFSARSSVPRSTHLRSHRMCILPPKTTEERGAIHRMDPRGLGSLLGTFSAWEKGVSQSGPEKAPACNAWDQTMKVSETVDLVAPDSHSPKMSCIRR